MNRRSPLPCDEILPQVLASLADCSNLVIEAAPGAGKTTRVPPAILGSVRGEVLVLEPRRIAARLAARRVAWELGEQAGETVGYQVRFEEVGGPRTRLRFLTEGVLTRRLLSDLDLRGVDAVVLDEFHERHLESDLALALLRRLQLRRPELRLIVMSATLDAAPIAQYLGECPIVRSEGRLFALTVTHLPHSSASLSAQVKAAVEFLIKDKLVGDILVFLPGAAEIRRAMRECSAIASAANLMLMPLHGDLSPAEQDRAVMPAQKRKVIFATNVAESSITVEGVTAVVDSGLVRTAAWSPWTGLPTLHVARTSKASARQRAGRAARTAPGRVIRLYTEQDYQSRAEYEQPEILRSDLSQLCLSLRAMKITPDSVSWVDAPPAPALKKAEQLLDRLGATSDRAIKLSRYPLSPRLSRILEEAMARGVGESGCAAVALLGSGAHSEKSDLMEAMDAPRDPRTLQQIEQLRRIVRPPRQMANDDDALLMSVLAGFPDRVARRRSGNQVLLSEGAASAEIAGAHPQSYEFLAVIDAEERSDRQLPLIRMACRIEPEWLIDLFPEHVSEQSALEWNRTAERVEAASMLMYDDLVLQESRAPSTDLEAVAAMLAAKALESGMARFVDQVSLDALLARVSFAGYDAPDIAEALRELCFGLRSLADLRESAIHFTSLLELRVGKDRLDKAAPTHIRLRQGRTTQVHYEQGKPPWIASRLQDFFGMRETPRIGPGQAPVVVHLLAPNRRPVQMTTDLAGFWERLYPQVRRELMRRYPRHEWPERPEA